MTDTLFSDVSEFQVPVTDRYPYSLLSIRSNDGNYLDHAWPANIAWARAALKAGKLWGLIVYYFYRPGVDGAAVLRSRVGTPDPRMVVMIDLESDAGRVSGDQSGQLRKEHDELASWLGDSRRVIGYGNTGDLDSLWRTKPAGLRLVVAAYGSNPSYPGKFAHQFTSTAVVAPFGPSDLNSADGMSQADLMSMFGLAGPKPPPAPAAPQAPGTLQGPDKSGTGYRWVADGTLSLAAFAAHRGATTLGLLRISAETGNLDAANFGKLDAYVRAGVNTHMPSGLVFYTVKP